MTHVGKWSFGLPAVPHVPFTPVPCAHVQKRRDQTVPHVGTDEEACAMANFDLEAPRRELAYDPGTYSAPGSAIYRGL